jgi:phytol kinase
MSYGDGLAAILGKAIKSPKYKVGNTQKSIAGSLTMLIVSLLIISIYYVINPVTYWIVKAIIMSIVVTIIEAVSIKGTDNITVPIAVFLMMILSSNILI